MVLALGVTLMITGMVTHWVISLLGVVLAVAVYGGMVLSSAAARASRLGSD
jgi:hypothetical protein